MYARSAATAPDLVPPPVTFTMTSGVRLTVRRICSIWAGVNRAEGPGGPRLNNSRNGRPSVGSRTGLESELDLLIAYAAAWSKADENLPAADRTGGRQIKLWCIRIHHPVKIRHNRAHRQIEVPYFSTLLIPKLQQRLVGICVALVKKRLKLLGQHFLPVERELLDIFGG
jgi:hypothetical protein